VRFVLLAALLGCGAPQEYRPADWEVDVVAALPLAAETVRVCIDGVGVSTIGAGNGRVAVRGVPPADTQVRLEVFDIDGEALFSTSWLEIGDDRPLVEASAAAIESTPCAAAGEFAAAGADDRLLVAHFVIE
jgi:hypothetical protein